MINSIIMKAKDAETSEISRKFSLSRKKNITLFGFLENTRKSKIETINLEAYLAKIEPKSSISPIKQ